jgi:hypothetical protein
VPSHSEAKPFSRLTQLASLFVPGLIGNDF